jgi:hypothetical protein
MKLWNAKASALLRGARIGPVGTALGMIEAAYSKCGTANAGNSSGARLAELENLPSMPIEMKWSRNATRRPDPSSPALKKW